MNLSLKLLFTEMGVVQKLLVLWILTTFVFGFLSPEPVIVVLSFSSIFAPMILVTLTIQALPFFFKDVVKRYFDYWNSKERTMAELGKFAAVLALTISLFYILYASLYNLLIYTPVLNYLNISG